MGLFSIFNKKKESAKQVKRAVVKVLEIEKLTDKGRKISFEIPNEYKSHFDFIPGQYVNVHVIINGQQLTRSYSICSGKDEALSIGVKAVESGVVSNYLVKEIKAGDELELDFPMGNFRLQEDMKTIVCFAAGSGITPFLSFAKSLKQDQQMNLFYGNSYKDSVFFKMELDSINRLKATYFYSRDNVENSIHGRLNKKNVSELIKSELSLLKADAFFICGPEEMIFDIKEVLSIFGVAKEKVHFELFTTPVTKISENANDSSTFTGVAKVSGILDGEIFRVELPANGKSVLEALIDSGADAPYSCKGGVCCTCKAKIIEGSAKMDINYSLTDEEVKEGFILTCQAHPTSEVLKIDYDV